ncbi:MAG: hypothetical protein CL609_22345 [Anaerolineaceae bacterium]|nr:hypothetical protein [Anaerolineaceae bacterium]
MVGGSSPSGGTVAPLEKAVFFVVKLTSHPVGDSPHRGDIISWLGVSPYRGQASSPSGGTVAPLEKAVFFFLFVGEGLQTFPNKHLLSLIFFC